MSGVEIGTDMVTSARCHILLEAFAAIMRNRQVYTWWAA